MQKNGLINKIILDGLKDKTDIEMYDVTTWETNNWNTHIAQYLKK